eukprot:scaffold102877_cov45-Phaeocystis_antarctica.AAC.1
MDAALEELGGALLERVWIDPQRAVQQRPNLTKPAVEVAFHATVVFVLDLLIHVLVQPPPHVALKEGSPCGVGACKPGPPVRGQVDRGRLVGSQGVLVVGAQLGREVPGGPPGGVIGGGVSGGGGGDGDAHSRRSTRET